MSKPRPLNLSPTMKLTLIDLLQDRPIHYHCRTPNEYGNLRAVRKALFNRRLIDGGDILTDYGRTVATKIMERITNASAS